ncbi:MAG TPA: cupin domain-containing protein [Streptosporangiaceae bacterium]|jgi:quercetin dioxygenase-like cupin family protein
MKIHRGRLPGAASENRTETFTGTVWADPVVAEPGLTVNTVCFTPGARTYWHSHGAGQILLVTHGRGFVQTRDDEKSLITPGDIVYVPAGEEHWHGAAGDSLLVHLAVSLGTTAWSDEVAEDLYRRTVTG